MRKIYHEILKEYFGGQLMRIRRLNGFTQAEMARVLFMEDRSYIDLEHGKVGCSAITLILFLIYLCNDIPGFIEGIRNAFESTEGQIA